MRDFGAPPLTAERVEWLIEEARAGRLYTDQGTNDEMDRALEAVAAAGIPSAVLRQRVRDAWARMP